MKKSEVKIGAVYTAKVSDKLVEVRIDSENRHGGWEAINLATGKRVRIKSAQRLRGEVGGKPARPSAEQPAKDDGRCQVPRCRRPEAINYLDRRVCQEHWNVLSGDDDQKAAAIRKQLGVDGQASVGPEATEAQAQAVEAPPARRERKAKAEKPRRVSALDAAAQILESAGQPMACQALIDEMGKRGLWSSPNGKTPSATLYAAILREIKAKGSQARFKKVERGQFAYAGGQA